MFRLRQAVKTLASLLQRGAVGMVTTHDLAITRLEEELGAVRNVHFEDHIEDGEVRGKIVLRVSD